MAFSTVKIIIAPPKNQLPSAHGTVYAHAMQHGGGKRVIVKKYSNRRLYDTSASRYVTLDEVSNIIQSGREVRVVDAKTNVDLTQATLTQIILESRRAARLLPESLLMHLIRMDDDALAEFFGRYMTWAMELYLQAKKGAQAIAPYNPFASLPFMATDALARMFSNGPWNRNANGAPPPEGMDLAPEPPLEEEPLTAKAEPNKDSNGVSELRREIEDLKQVIMAMKGD